MKALRYFCLSILLFIFNSCSHKNAAYSPYAFAPKSINSNWAPLADTTIKPKYCSFLFPKNYTKGDFSLAELIDIALLNNPLTKQSWANARSLAALYGQSLSSYYPEVNIDASYLRERQTMVNTAAEAGVGKKHEAYYRTLFEPEAILSYTIFDFGKRKSSSRSAKQALFYADWMHNQEIQNIIQTVMNSYYEYQYQKQALKAFQADLTNAKMSLDAANQKFLSGIAAIGDLTQAQTKFLQTKMNLIAQENEVENTYAELVNDLGIFASRKIDIADLPENAEIDFVIENLDILVKKAQHMRQDLLAANANLKYSKQQVKNAKSLSRPTFDSRFEIGKNYYDHNIHEDYHFAASFKLSIPIFKGLYYKNGIKNAQAKLLKAKALLDQTELEVVKEVTNSHNNILSAAKTLKYAKKYLDSAKKDFDIAISRYKAGVTTILDVLSAQSSLADARAKNAKANKDWYSSVATLVYATGALCIPEKIKDDVSKKE